MVYVHHGDSRSRPYFVESAIKLPSVGPPIEICDVPMLKKSSVASSISAIPKTDVAATMIGPEQFGSRWRTAMRSGEAPAACAASTNSRLRSDAQLARTTRATTVHM